MYTVSVSGMSASLVTMHQGLSSRVCHAPFYIKIYATLRGLPLTTIERLLVHPHTPLSFVQVFNQQKQPVQLSSLPSTAMSSLSNKGLPNQSVRGDWDELFVHHK
jgi:hypothetical protein